MLRKMRLYSHIVQLAAFYHRLMAEGLVVNPGTEKPLVCRLSCIGAKPHAILSKHIVEKAEALEQCSCVAELIVVKGHVPQ